MDDADDNNSPAIEETLPPKRQRTFKEAVKQQNIQRIRQRLKINFKEKIDE